MPPGNLSGSGFRAVTAIVMLLSVAPVSAQVADGLGTRAAGMGGAFVAVADDATAVYWNPAGLASGAFGSLVADLSILGTHAGTVPAPTDPAGRVRAGIIAFGIPPFGLAYYRDQADTASEVTAIGVPLPRGPAGVRSVTRIATDTLAATLEQSLADGVHVGASLKAVRGRVVAEMVAVHPDESLDDTWNATDAGSAATRFDVDAGLMIARGGWRIGLAGRHLAAPAFTTADGRQVRLERRARVGVALVPRDRWTVAADADLTTTADVGGRRRLAAAGVEVWPTASRRLAVRAGVAAHTVGDFRATGSVGGSIALTSLLVADAQVTFGADPLRRGVSLGLRLHY